MSSMGDRESSQLLTGEIAYDSLITVWLSNSLFDVIPSFLESERSSWDHPSTTQQHCPACLFSITGSMVIFLSEMINMMPCLLHPLVVEAHHHLIA